MDTKWTDSLDWLRLARCAAGIRGARGAAGMEGRLAPEQLDNLRRTDFEAWRRYLHAVAQEQIGSGNDVLAWIGQASWVAR